METLSHEQQLELAQQRLAVMREQVMLRTVTISPIRSHLEDLRARMQPSGE